MIRVSRLVGYVLFSAYLAAAGEGSPSPLDYLTLTAEIEGLPTRVGDKFDIRVHLMNSGTVPVTVYMDSPDIFFYRFIVARASGQWETPVALTEYGRASTDPVLIFSRASITIKPQKEQSTTFELSKLYDFTSPGTYGVVCFIELPGEPGTSLRRRLKSSLLTFTISQ